MNLEMHRPWPEDRLTFSAPTSVAALVGYLESIAATVRCSGWY